MGFVVSGIGAGVPGVITRSTGARKLLDVRDFSDEGGVELTPITPAADGSVVVAGTRLVGAGRIARLAAEGTWYAGVFRELPLGKVPAADVNGGGDNTHAFPLGEIGRAHV